MAVIKKFATIVSIDYDLSNVQIGEKVQFSHNRNNEFDKNAIDAIRVSGKEKIGYMSASAHTTLPGCANNSQLIRFIPSPTVPLIGTVVEKKDISFRNGTIAPVLKVEIYVVIQDKAV